jgi:hypothetical protein
LNATLALLLDSSCLPVPRRGIQHLLGKFPYVPVLMAHYLAGETLVEAYWKSVAMPGQGLFIGEPLAAPFRKP